jgi:hypothetical protein
LPAATVIENSRLAASALGGTMDKHTTASGIAAGIERSNGASIEITMGWVARTQG